MAGQILGDRYQVERQIGKQTGRWTLLARDLTTQQLVVLKVLFLDEQVEWDDLKLFEREVEILKSLSHPSIPQYLGYFEQELPQDKALVLIQTYVEGKSLEQCLQQGRVFSEAEAKQLAKALLNILLYLHKRQPPIIHRDLKPSNILLAKRQLYLVDFGSVKAMTASDSTAFTVVGTYGYMPPEQFSGRAIPASDLYSLGATLIALVTGTHPSSLPRQGIRIDLTATNLSPAFTDWLGWLHEPNLDRRVQTAQEALDALEQGRPSQPTIAAVSQPHDSRVQLTKTPDRFDLVIPTLMGQTHLVIDGQTLTLTSKRLGFGAGRPQSVPRSTISHLECQQRISGSEPFLGIWAGTQCFDLTINTNLSPMEIDWLTYELVAWLKVPVQP